MPIRVLVVDDSAFFRYSLTKHLEADPEITVIGSARDGLDALDQVVAHKPDVVILDVEMPRMDGLVTLKHIMTRRPTPVIMLSAFTQPGARTTIQALMRGAVDFTPQPQANINLHTVIKELIAKIKIAAGAHTAALPPPDTLPLAPSFTLHVSASKGPQPFQKGDPLIVMAASTGGPRALQTVLSTLPANLPAAMLIVQHMPPGFTHSLAQRLHDTSPLIVQEAANGDRLAQGMALLAPGNFHLRLKNFRQVVLDSGPRRQHVRPSADVTMESAAQYHGSKVIGVVLTGMGQDGTAGAVQIKSAGGKIIAEHQLTSVVYGMPASIVNAGLADTVVPLPEVAPTLVKLLNDDGFRI